MNPRRKRRLMAVLALTVAAASAVGLVLYALSQNIDLFYTPSEIIQGKDGKLPHVGQRLRIGGLVVPGTVEREANSLRVAFKLVDDQGGIVTVHYEGILPDLFREGQGIVAHGHLTSATDVQAFEVLAKHDEEYMPPEVAEAVKGIKHFKPEYGNDAQ